MSTSSPKDLNLALQGGGSHGAFTWGALDRLLEENGIRIESISGASSGAMNAVLMAQGLMEGGRAGARAALAKFWQRIGIEFGAYSGYGSGPSWRSSTPDVMPSIEMLLRLTREFSPYQLNPLGHDPLRDLLESSVDFARLRAASPVRLYVGATQVRTGKLRVFQPAELSVDVLLASACVPSLHHTVMIDGEPYWDGGFTGNPPVFPLVFDSEVADIMVIVVQPLSRPGTPTTAEEIRGRMQELGFSSAFLREMRAIAMSKQHIGATWLSRGPLEQRIERLRIHVLQDDGVLAQLDARSRVNTLPGFIGRLHDLGYAAAEDWLVRNVGAIGVRSTVDLAALFA
jgi:NTE family protein